MEENGKIDIVNSVALCEFRIFILEAIIQKYQEKSFTLALTQQEFQSIRKEAAGIMRSKYPGEDFHFPGE